MRRQHDVLIRPLRALDLADHIEDGLLAQELRFRIEAHARALPVLGEAENEAVVFARQVDVWDSRGAGREDLADAPGSGVVAAGSPTVRQQSGHTGRIER